MGGVYLDDRISGLATPGWVCCRCHNNPALLYKHTMLLTTSDSTRSDFPADHQRFFLPIGEVLISSAYRRTDVFLKPLRTTVQPKTCPPKSATSQHPTAEHSLGGIAVRAAESRR